MPFLPSKMGGGGNSKPRVSSHKHPKGPIERKCKSCITIDLPCLPLLSKVPISKMHSGAQGITAVSIHPTEGQGQIAVRTKRADCAPWVMALHLPLCQLPCSQQGAVGSMGCTVLEVFMFESLVLSFECGKWFPRESHFYLDQTGEPITLTELHISEANGFV